MSGCSPWVLSVWGSDVYDFPYKSPIHKWHVRKNLKAADIVASTSLCMAKQTSDLVGNLNGVSITPFGVDIFEYVNDAQDIPKVGNRLVIGTVKGMSHRYGIDVLIKSFAILVSRFALVDIKSRPELTLRLVGGGDQLGQLSALATQLGIADKVLFVGQVPHAQVPSELSKIDIFVALSRLESFGVAILEAGAAGRPVVVSDADGLLEVTVNEVTGLVVPRNDPLSAADALERLVINDDLRIKMGKAARAHVVKNYTWSASIQKMLRLYEQTIETFAIKNR
jgi:glycosyltransferase involved in cell wall biosynthesis